MSMTTLARFAGTMLSAGALFASAGTLAGPPFAEPAPDGKTLVVPDEVAAKGTVYHTLSGRDRQIHFSSDAPLEKIKGQSNQVIGYAVAGPSGSPAKLQAGEWHLPVESMKTGIPLRDEHLASKDWLDAASHPNIVFQIERVEDVRVVREADAFTTYEATLIGEVTIRGVTRPTTAPKATITFLPASDSTARIAKGDLMAIRAKLQATLSAHNVSHPTVGNKVSDTVDIDVALYLSTVKPK